MARQPIDLMPSRVIARCPDRSIIAEPAGGVLPPGLRRVISMDGFYCSENTVAGFAGITPTDRLAIERGNAARLFPHLVSV